MICLNMIKKWRDVALAIGGCDSNSPPATGPTNAGPVATPGGRRNGQ
ncbi:MAG: hypothetical protein ACI9UN_004647 [Granulosicoccus sp.]|jgi:hypothetical protein